MCRPTNSSLFHKIYSTNIYQRFSLGQWGAFASMVVRAALPHSTRAKWLCRQLPTSSAWCFNFVISNYDTCLGRCLAGCMRRFGDLAALGRYCLIKRPDGGCSRERADRGLRTYLHVRLLLPSLPLMASHLRASPAALRLLFDIYCDRVSLLMRVGRFQIHHL